MAIDNRKSKEKIKEELKEVEKLDPVDIPKDKPEEEPEDTPIVEEQTQTEDIEEEPVEEEESDKNVAEAEEPIVDYKEKFTASTREAQVLSAKNKKLTEIIDKASELPELTEDELVREYPDWDALSDFEKKLAKDNLLNKRRFELVNQAVQETKKIDEWVEKVDKFVDEASASGKYSSLEGREDAFRRFCLKPTRRGVDFEDLVRAFLYDIQPPVKHKGSLLETGTGGPKEPPKSRELSVEEVKMIREKDPKKYRQLVKEGKIKIEI